MLGHLHTQTDQTDLLLDLSIIIFVSIGLLCKLVLPTKVNQ